MPPRYLSRTENQCPSCYNEVSTGYHTLLYLSLLVLFLVLVLLFAVYWRVTARSQEAQLCTAFRNMDQHTKKQLRDLLEASSSIE
jgi:hypothetical protein